MSVLVSIVIPCYNHGKYIQETIESIENAKGKYGAEIIIVNDGSTDSFTISILAELEQKGYFVLHQKNGGLGNARNNGVRLAKGKYILPLDSDNTVLEPYLVDAIELLEKDDFYDIVYGNAIYFGERKGDWIVGEYSLLKFITNNYIDACAVYRKSVWEKLGGYDEKIPKMGLEDWDFWLNSSFNGFRFFYLQKPCFNYRVLKESMIRSFSENEMKLSRKYIEFKYKKHLFFPDLEYYYARKMLINDSFLASNLSVKKLIYVLFLKVFSKITKKKLS
jgi:glycosyltransferase involved in cell wall biosynthesis